MASGEALNHHRTRHRYADALPLRHTEASAPSRAPEKRGLYAKPWISEMILDMADYEVGDDLAATFAVEPAAGSGGAEAATLPRADLAVGDPPYICLEDVPASRKTK